jgi:hypothetical protein
MMNDPTGQLAPHVTYDINHKASVRLATLAKAASLAAPRDMVHRQVFNVGSTEQNYRVRDAEIIAETFEGCSLRFGETGSDNRGYRGSFDKIHERLPGFSCASDARKGAWQLRDLFERIDMQQEVFLFRGFTRLKQLEHLLRTRQIDREFYWTA